MAEKERRTHVPIAGPLVVSETNPRYSAVASGDAVGRAVYLTGSHIWNNLHDGMGPGAECPEVAEEFDFSAYLDFLEEREHNFIRLWRWEQFKSDRRPSGPPARRARPGDPGGLHPAGRRHRS